MLTPGNRPAPPGDLPAIAAPTMRALRVLSLACFVQMVGALSVVGSLAAIAGEWSLADSQGAYLISAFGLTFALAAPLLQVWLGQLNRRRQLLLGLGVFSASALGFAAAPGYGALLASRIGMGLGAAFISPVLGALASSLVRRELQGSAIAIVLFGLSVAGMAGLPASAWIAENWGARWLFAGIGVSGLATALLVVRRVPSQGAGDRVELRTLLSMLTDPVTFSALLVVFFIATGVFSTYAFIVPILREVHGAGPDAVTLALLVLGVAGVAGNLVVVRAARHYGADTLLRAGILLFAANLIFMMLSPTRLAYIYGALVVWSFATDILWPTQQRRMIDLRPDLRGIGLALTASFLFLGIGFGSAIAGRVYPLLGYVGVLSCSLASLLAALLCLHWSARLARAGR